MTEAFDPVVEDLFSGFEIPEGQADSGSDGGVGSEVTKESSGSPLGVGPLAGIGDTLEEQIRGVGDV